MEEETLPLFGRYVVQKMKEQGYATRKELAKRSHLPLSTICSYINGIFFPSEKYLKKLAPALGVEPIEIEQLRPSPENPRPVYIPRQRREALIETLSRIEMTQSRLEQQVEELCRKWSSLDTLMNTYTLLLQRYLDLERK